MLVRNSACSKKANLKVLFIKNTSFYKLWSFLYCVRTTRKASRLFFLICTINVPFVTCHKAFVLTSQINPLPKSHFLDVTSQKGWMFCWLGCTTHVFQKHNQGAIWSFCDVKEKLCASCTYMILHKWPIFTWSREASQLFLQQHPECLEKQHNSVRT